MGLYRTIIYILTGGTCQRVSPVLLHWKILVSELTENYIYNRESNIGGIKHEEI